MCYEGALCRSMGGRYGPGQNRMSRVIPQKTGREQGENRDLDGLFSLFFAFCRVKLHFWPRENKRTGFWKKEVRPRRPAGGSGCSPDLFFFKNLVLLFSTSLKCVFTGPNPQKVENSIPHDPVLSLFSCSLSKLSALGPPRPISSGVVKCISHEPDPCLLGARSRRALPTPLAPGPEPPPSARSGGRMWACGEELRQGGAGVQAGGEERPAAAVSSWHGTWVQPRWQQTRRRCLGGKDEAGLGGMLVRPPQQQGEYAP
jgi:hypothetical protein